MNTQRTDQNQERNNEVGDVEIRQRVESITGYRPLPAKYPTTASAVLAPTTAVSSSRDARRTPARLPKATSSAFRRRGPMPGTLSNSRSEEHTSELQSRLHLVCRLLLEKKKIQKN